MLKINERTVFSIKNGKCTIISFDHDIVITLRGTLLAIMEPLRVGTDLDFLAKNVSCNENQLKQILNIFKDLGLLVGSTYNGEVTDFRVLEFENNGELSLEEFPHQDQIYAPYKVDEV